MSSLKDLTNIKFGMLTVDKRLKGDTWLCKCECGNTRPIVMTSRQLKTRANPNCGCSRRENLKGKKFGELTVLHYDKNGKWVCECKCGNSDNISVREIDLKNGIVSSCGCESASSLANKQFGKLKVIRIDRVSNGTRRWVCKCNCGNNNEISIVENELKNGNRISCGNCKKYSLAGKTFGELKVIKSAGANNWWCSCSCESKEPVIVPDWALINGDINNCGCGDRLEIYKQNNAYKHINSSTTIIYASNTGTKYYIDRSIFETIKEYRWREQKNSLMASTSNGIINIHSIILGEQTKYNKIGYKDGNNKNIKQYNLLIDFNNGSNKSIRADNKTGCTGVSLYGNNKYRAQICVDGQNIVLGVRANIDDAIELRKRAEQKYYKDNT